MNSVTTFRSVAKVRPTDARQFTALHHPAPTDKLSEYRLKVIRDRLAPGEQFEDL